MKKTFKLTMNVCFGFIFLLALIGTDALDSGSGKGYRFLSHYRVECNLTYGKGNVFPTYSSAMSKSEGDAFTIRQYNESLPKKGEYFLPRKQIEVSNLPTVQAVIGYTATIPCNLSTPLADDEASLILWYRLDTPNPIYTLDVRNTDLQSARHFPAGNARGRTYFDVSVHPPVLVLDGVEIGDEGDYKCRVDLKRSRTLILLSRLDVIVPPGEPIIMDEHGQRLRGTIGPYDEGSTLTLICEVDGGDPSPNVTWWRDDSMIDNDFNSTQGFVRNTMVVRHIRRSDLMAEYICKASNSEVGKPREALVRLDINLLPLEVKLMNLHFPVLAGLLQEVKCEALGSRPRAFLTWWLDDKKIEAGTYEKFQRGGNYTLSTLQFIPNPQDHGKKLVCKAVNTVFPETAVTAEIILQVQSIPIVILEFPDHSNHSFVEEDTNVQMECLIRADPPIIDITWHHNDRLLREDRIKGILIRNHTIEIERAKKEHRGRYRCFATNAIGRGSSSYVQLDIMFTPACKAPASLTYGIGNSESAKLTCDVEAIPDVVLYRWVLNNSLGVVVLRDWNDESFDSVLEYTPEDDTDFGTLLCWGQNSVGTQKEPCIFNIVPAGAPDAPFDCHVFNESANSLVVECRPGFDRGLKQLFHMELYDSVEENIATNLTNSQKPSFKATGLVPGMSYVVVVYASNVKGRSNSLLLVASTLSAHGSRDGLSFLSNQLLIVLVGAVVILVIALGVAIFFIRSRTSNDDDSKDSSYMASKNECERDKKDTDESHETSEKGPDIIPHSKDSEVFYMDSILDDIHCAECLSKEDSPPTELIRQKYMATVL